MVQHTKHLSYGFLLSLSILLLALFVSACDLGGLGGLGGTPTPTATATATATSATSATTMTAFTGDGYTISYPPTWKMKKDSTGVTFTDPNGIAYFQIHVAPNPEGIVSTSNQVTLGLETFKSQAKNYQQVSVPNSTTLAGETWSQGAATGDITPSGQSTQANVKIYVISDNHPASSTATKAFIIGYATGSQVFDLANAGFFQPMLQTFKFTS